MVDIAMELFVWASAYGMHGFREPRPTYLCTYDSVKIGLHAIQTTEYCYTRLNVAVFIHTMGNNKKILLFEAYSPLPLL
jgi:hypothetical protein